MSVPTLKPGWRWVLVIPAALFAWGVVFLVGILTYDAIEEGMCPAGAMDSGHCMNQGVQSMLGVVVYVFAGISAVAVEIAAALTAPSHKAEITWATFLAGCAVATLFGFAAHAYGEAATAVITGLIGASLIGRRAGASR